MSTSILRALGLNPHILEVGQKELEYCFDRNFPHNISEQKILETYCDWLAYQVPAINLKTSKETSETIFYWCQYLSTRGFDKHIVISTFIRYREDFVSRHPSFRTAFNYALRDIEITYKKPASKRKAENKSATPRAISTPRALAGVPLSRSHSPASPYAASLSENINPRALGTTFKQESSPTDPNMDMAAARYLANHDKRKAQSANNKQADGHPGMKLPPNYLCKRCGEKGHRVQDCPTNMDPRYDSAPGHDYVCSYCRKVGAHHAGVCPKNRNPESLNMQRMANGISPNLAIETRRKGQPPATRSRIALESAADYYRDIDRRDRSTPVRGSSSAYTPASEPSVHPQRVRLLGPHKKPSCPDSSPEALAHSSPLMHPSRLEYVQSGTDDWLPGQEPPEVGLCAAVTGSNTAPLGPLKRRNWARGRAWEADSYHPDGAAQKWEVDSYRPLGAAQKGEVDSYRPKRVTEKHDAPKIASLSLGNRSEGRLSPWDEPEFSPSSFANNRKRGEAFPIETDIGTSELSEHEHEQEVDIDAFLRTLEKTWQSAAGDSETRALSNKRRKTAHEPVSWSSPASEVKMAFPSQSAPALLGWNNAADLPDMLASECQSGSRVPGAESHNPIMISDTWAMPDTVLAAGNVSRDPIIIMDSPERPTDGVVADFSFTDGMMTSDLSYSPFADAGLGDGAYDGFEMDVDEPEVSKKHVAKIVLGKTIKLLVKEPPYDPFVIGLFQNRENVYINKSERPTAVEMWEEQEQKDAAEEMANLTMNP